MSPSSGSAAARLGSVPRIYLAGLAIVTLIGSALRMRAVFYPLRHDEAYTFLTYGLQPVWTTLSTSIYIAHADARYRNPIKPLLFVLAGSCLAAAWRRMPEHRMDEKHAAAGSPR